jgi:hypothetical protein
MKPIDRKKLIEYLEFEAFEYIKDEDVEWGRAYNTLASILTDAREESSLNVEHETIEIGRLKKHLEEMSEISRDRGESYTRGVFATIAFLLNDIKNGSWKDWGKE